MNAVILSFDPNEKHSVICEGNSLIVKCMGAVELDRVKSAKKAKNNLHNACERASETHDQTLHGQEQSRMRMASIRESRDSDRFLVNTQVQSHALLRQGFGTSVPFIFRSNEARPHLLADIIMLG